MPNIELYPAGLHSLIEEHGAATVNEVSCAALGYPALLITTTTEERSLMDRWEKEKS